MKFENIKLNVLKMIVEVANEGVVLELSISKITRINASYVHLDDMEINKIVQDVLRGSTICILEATTFYNVFHVLREHLDQMKDNLIALTVHRLKPVWWVQLQF